MLARGVLLCALISGLASCATMSEICRENDVLCGGLVGAGAGSAIGAVINEERGAAWGALIGGGIGTAAGVYAAQRREEFQNDADYLDAEIAQTESAIEAKEDELRQLENVISENQRLIVELENQTKRDQATLNKTRDRLKEVELVLKDNDKERERYEQTLEYLDAAVSEAKSAEATTAEERARVEERTVVMQTKKDQMIAQLERLNKLDKRLEEQQQRMIAATDSQGT